MADEDPFSLTGAEPSIGGNGSNPFGRGGDTDSKLAKIKRGAESIVSVLERGVDRVVNKLKGASDDLSEAVSGEGAAPQGSRIGKTKLAGTVIKNLFGGGGGGGGGLRGLFGGGGGEAGAMKFIGRTPMAAGLTTGFAAANAGINAINARFDRAREGVLEADRMSVLYQQMTGKSQLGVSSAYRMPLTNYRLGAGGINALMGLEAQTGISGRQQASSVEALRTISGYSLSAGDVGGMMASLASAPTANRMFMMTGMGLIGPGGKQNSTMSVIQNLVRVAGLTNKDVLDSALLPGSVTRAKLTQMGVPPELQTQVIQYAKENLVYKEKGGKGMYDPSNKGARRRMGIEENFATQVEETQRLETKRDEKFYRRQVDNFANLERQTQTLTQAFGALENSLSGIMGVVGQNRIATSVMQSVMPMGGDPDGSSRDPGLKADTSIKVPTYSGKRSLSDVRNMPGFKKIHPKMQDRILAMMRANPNVGFGEGIRDANAQRNMFMQRYKKTSSPTNSRGEKNVSWDGSYWEHTSGAPAAPPGRSMHEIGLAVDLVGDFEWVKKNAHKFGLQHFGDVNGEPWHVQPAELPRSRAKYEESGAAWGRGPGGAAPFDKSSDFGEGLDHATGRIKGPQAGPGGTYEMGLTGGAIADRVARKLGDTDPGATRGAAGTRMVQSSAPSFSGGKVAGFSHGGISKSGVNIEQWSSDFLRSIGAPATLANMEVMSAWIAAEGTRASFNPLAVVTKPKSGKWSFFNHLSDNVGVINFSSYQQGLEANVRHIMNHGKGVVAALKKASTNPYDTVGSIENMVKGWAPHYAARKVLESRHVPTNTSSGDPAGTMKAGSAVGGAVSLVGGNTINLNPNINISASGSPNDLRKVAKELVSMIQRELELQNLRSN